jgi:Lar family restriction alleviation protein
MTEELKPCPFCGGEVKASKISRYSQRHQVACYSQICAAQPSIVESKKSVAISAWNSRAPQHPAIALESISDDTIIEYLVMKGYVVEKGIV